MSEFMLEAKISHFLDGAWSVQAGRSDGEIPETVVGQVFEGTVPGCVHTDLLSAGLIPDPYLEQNELLVSWIGQTDWIYTREFDIDSEVMARPEHELVFDGLDTIAEIRLNEKLIGKAKNMHHPWHFDVSDVVKLGTNKLVVLFISNEREALEESRRLGELPRVLRLPYNFIRKMACNYSWDWGPELVTCGIWHSVRLEAHGGSRIENVRPLVMLVDQEGARIDVHVDGRGLEENMFVEAMLYSPDGVLVQRSTSPARKTLTFSVQSPQIWWPTSHGPQPLYKIVVYLRLKPNSAIKPTDVWEGQIGIRQIHLDTSPDEIGSAFTFQINGVPVFARGANWIPNDCFPTRLSKEEYRKRLQQAVDAGMNMLRVWGGGLYETDEFYDLCDEMGILVWQDFAFACACYPEEKPFPELIEAEARANICRLARHPSLALWNGNNENFWLITRNADEKTGLTWKETVGSRGWGSHFYLDLLPKVVAELDPSRPYWPGSPWSGTWELDVNDDRHGCNHVWDAWNTKDFTVQWQYKPRFVAEYGHAGPATFATWQQALPDGAKRQPDSPEVVFRNRCRDGERKLKDRTREHFPLPKDFDDWLYVTQLNQARAIRLSAAWHRSLKPRCMGTLVWQLNDCWPVTSWAAVDGYGRLKPLWYELRRAYADRFLTIQPENGEGSPLWLHGDNETDSDWGLSVQVRRLTFDGNVQATAIFNLSMVPRGKQSLRLPEDIVTPRDGALEMVIAEASDGTRRAEWFFARDKDAKYPSPEFDAEVHGDKACRTVTVRAKTLLRDLAIFPDRLSADAMVDDQLITLLPGENAIFRITGIPDAKAGELTQPPVLRCANPFGAN